MKQFTMIVRPFVAQAVLDALRDLGLEGWIVHEAKGYSRQKGYLERYVGSEYSLAFLPKVEISVWLSAELTAETAARLQQIARTAASATARYSCCRRRGMRNWRFRPKAIGSLVRPDKSCHF